MKKSYWSQVCLYCLKALRRQGLPPKYRDFKKCLAIDISYNPTIWKKYFCTEQNLTLIVGRWLKCHGYQWCHELGLCYWISRIDFRGLVWPDFLTQNTELPGTSHILLMIVWGPIIGLHNWLKGIYFSISQSYLLMFPKFMLAFIRALTLLPPAPPPQASSAPQNKMLIVIRESY